MPVPILLITGYLGAGKTTLINRLLCAPRGRRIAAVVNDFGAVNIDARLLASVSEDVISLKNGCICCSLLGDLLQTLSAVLRRTPPPDAIVIETSGVSDPGEIIRTLLDPVIWSHAALETVICVADAHALAEQAGLIDEALWSAQMQAADFVALSKTDLLDDAARKAVAARLGSRKDARAIHVMVDGDLPDELLFAGAFPLRPTAPTPASGHVSPAFSTVSWTSSSLPAMDGFRRAIERHGASLVRAKGLVRFAERPDEALLFQLVGARATLARAPASLPAGPAAQIVFIARLGELDVDGLLASLDACCVAR